MSQKIKKRIKHTVPGFVIICLINLLVVGLFFNNLNLPDLALGINNAQADTATTSVTVKNAPPAFTVQPAESEVSTTTSPTNTGASVTFTGQASDPETNQYYLIVCSTNAVAPANGDAPSCGAVQRCRSGATNSGVATSCRYDNVQDAAQTQDWYAFVCDNHATEADCSLASQGTGDSGSPLSINHNPFLASVSTTDDNKVPGGTFQVTAQAYDNDSAGTQDDVTFYICDTNSFATSTGCASGHELCHATSTTNPQCSFADTAPTVDQSYTYYAFAYDNHYHQATNTPSSTYTIINVAPQASNVVLTASAFTGSNINPGIKNGTSTIVYATSTSITDNNGCTDLDQATSSAFLSSVGFMCVGDANNCYHMAAASCAITECTDDQDTTATVVCSSTIANYAVPTDASAGNPKSALTWYARMQIFDEAASGAATSSGVDMNTVTALDVTENTIPYGQIKSGQDTDYFNATTTVVNFGNAPLDSTVTGTDMTGPSTIAVYNQYYSLNMFNYPTGATALTSTTTPEAGLSIARPTSAANVSGEVLWGIGIPAGTQSGVYTGTNTFGGALESGGNWN